MQSTVVELSRYTSDDKPSNSEWTTRLSSPVKVEDGDFIIVKQAFIDTRLIDNESILIEKDVAWTIQFMYWVNNIGMNVYEFGALGTRELVKIGVDGMPYLLFDNDRNQPVIDDFTINIPAGIYERAYLAEYITRQLQAIAKPQARTYDQILFCNDEITATYDASSNFTGFTKAASPPSTITITPFQRPMFVGQKQTAPNYNQYMIYRGKNNEWRTAYYYPMTNNQWGTYALNNRNLATWVGPLNLGSNNLLEFFLGFYPVGDGTEHGIADGGFIGASQMAFVYNDNNDGKFSFQYMHSPILNGGNESVGTFTYFPAQTATTNCKTSYLNAYSGIMFCNMYTNLSDDPNTDPFFKQMGFKFNDLVPAEIPSFFKSGNIPYEANGAQNSAFVPFNYYDTFLKYTTRNYMSMGDIVSPATVKLGSYNITSYTSIYTTQALGLENAVNQYYFETSETTEPIKASLPPISSDTNGGHYLIDLQCSYVNDFITQDKNYQVKAVVGNYFLSGDSFAMSMGPDSFVYQHKGEAISLASVKIRILNPITKLPETNLGTNSTVYLQITKEPPQGNQEAKK